MKPHFATSIWPFPECEEVTGVIAGNNSPTSRHPTLKLSGFLQFDSVWFEETSATRMAFGDIADSTAVRRARVAISGDFVQELEYKLDVDFAASGHPSFRDMFVEIRDRLIAERIVVGFFKAPFQMDALTSSKNFTFAERSPSFAFAPFRQIGLGASGSLLDEKVAWSVAGFRAGTDRFAVAQSDDGYGVAARMTALPWDEADDRGLIHLGADLSHLQPSGQAVQYDSKLSFFVEEEPGDSTTSIPVLVDTGLIRSEAVNLFNLEAAGVFGPLHYQNEFTWAFLDQIDGPPLLFYGGYSQVGWILTGESRPYDRSAGVFTAVTPKESVFQGGPGAWEVALRGTFLNLNSENIQGGRLSSAEVVLNWYLNQYLSMKFDCVRGFIDHSNGSDSQLSIYGARVQIIF